MPEDLTEPRRCTAKAKGSGSRCKRTPAPGATVCAMHGGSAPQVKAAAEARDLESRAAVALAKLWPSVGDAVPVKDPVSSMEQLAGQLSHMLDVVGGKVNDLDHLAGGTGLTQLRGELVLLDKVAGHLRALLEAMARLGIAERHLQLEQERANVVVAALLAALDVAGLAPPVRSLVIDRYLERLGDLIPAGTSAVVVGEVEG